MIPYWAYACLSKHTHNMILQQPNKLNLWPISSLTMSLCPCPSAAAVAATVLHLVAQYGARYSSQWSIHHWPDTDWWSPHWHFQFAIWEGCHCKIWERKGTECSQRNKTVVAAVLGDLRKCCKAPSFNVSSSNGAFFARFKTLMTATGELLFSF